MLPWPVTQAPAGSVPPQGGTVLAKEEGLSVVRVREGREGMTSRSHKSAVFIDWIHSEHKD